MAACITATIGTIGGCSTSDVAADASVAEESTGPGPSTTSENDETDGPGDPTGYDTETAGSTSPTGGDSTGPSGASESDSDAADCMLQCGEGGQCTFDNDGAAVCECFDGYANAGDTCVPCLDPPENVDLAMSELQLRVTVNGSAPPASPLEYGDIFLKHRDTGDVVALGDTRTPLLTASVIAGAYDVYFSRRAGASVVPANRHVRIGTIDAQIDVEDTIEITAVGIAGEFSFDGQPAPASPTESGRVWLHDPVTGDEVLLGTTSVGHYEALVVPGDYELVYEAIAGADTAPANGRGVFGTLQVEASEVGTNIDIPTVTIAGTFNFDGVPAPDSTAENGRLSLRSGDDVINLGETRVGQYAVRVLPRAYDVVYESLAGADIAPANQRATIAVVGAYEDLSQDIDVLTVALSGVLTFNGAAAPADPTDDGFVVLRHASGDEVLLGMTSTGAYARRVVAGPYDVFYVQDTSRDAAPRNTNARIRELLAEKGTLGDIDIQRVDMSGAITLGGATPPDSDYQDGHIFLRDMITGDSVLLGNTRAGNYSAPIVPGDYEIVYVAENAGGPLPVNTGAVIGDVSVPAGGPVAIAIDVPARMLNGAVTVNGEPAPMDSLDVGNVFLVDAYTQDQVYLGNTYEGDYQQTLTPGDYLVYYRVAASQGGVPANSNANLGCWRLQ